MMDRETISERPFRVYQHPDGRRQLMCQSFDGTCPRLPVNNRFDPSIGMKRYLCAEHLALWDQAAADVEAEG